MRNCTDAAIYLENTPAVQSIWKLINNESDLKTKPEPKYPKSVSQSTSKWSEKKQLPMLLFCYLYFPAQAYMNK